MLTPENTQESGTIKWNGAANARSCVSNWVDQNGAHIGLYGSMTRESEPRSLPDVVLTATIDGEVTLQVLEAGKPVFINVHKLLPLLRELQLHGFGQDFISP